MKRFILFTVLLIEYILCNTFTIPLSKKEVDKEVILKRLRTLASTDDFTIDQLTNYNQFMYAGDIQIGDGSKTFSVLFDTGSNQLWIPSYSCVTTTSYCPGFTKYYTCMTSDGCTYTNSYYSIPYGKGQVQGQIVNVGVSVSGLLPVQTPLLLVNRTQDFSNLQSDGLFGLGMYNQFSSDKTSFVTQLYNNGMINSMMFSFYLGFGKKDSQLTFGGFNPNKVANTSEIYYHQVSMNGIKDDNQRWSIKTKSVQLGGYSFDFTATANTAIVDSGTSLILLSLKSYNLLISYLTELYPLTQRWDGYYYISCSSSSLPDLQFILTDTTGKDRTYIVPSSFYIMKSNGVCFLAISSLPSGISDVQLILGDVFMRRYMSIFTYNNQTVGLTLSVADPSDDYTQTQLATWAIILIVVGGVLTISIIAFCLYRKAKERRERNRNYLNQQLISAQQPFQGQGVPIGGGAQYYPANNYNQNNQGYVVGQPVYSSNNINMNQNQQPPMYPQNQYQN